MDEELFRKKIKNLDNEKLIALLQLNNQANKEIVGLAREEAKKRNIATQQIDSERVVVPGVSAIDEVKLDKWNWGAFLLAPFWTLANRLDGWTYLTLIPGLNIPVIIYLGIKGNKIAFNKAKSISVDDFMAIQRHWNKWALRIIWIWIAIGVVWFMSE
jgi:hypothetical protein